MVGEGEDLEVALGGWGFGFIVDEGGGGGEGGFAEESVG